MRTRLKICTLAGLILLAGLLLPAAGLAGTNQWTTNGPYGGGVRSLALSPSFASDHTLFAVSYNNGVFKSTDAGSNWSPANTGLPANTGVSSLALSPNFAADHTLFAGTDGGAFKSTDAGANWSAVNTGLTSTYVISLALSPNFASDHTLFAGTAGGGVFKSTDAGASWSAVNSGLPASTSVGSLALSPNFAADHTLFAGTGYGGSVFKSTDAGASWSAANTGLTATDVSSLALSPNFAADHTLFAGTDGGVFKSTDAGASWSAVNTGLPITWVKALALSPNFATDHTLFAGENSVGTAGGVFKSTDGGASWSAVNSGLPASKYVWSLALSPNFATDHTLFAGTGNPGGTGGGTPFGSVFKSTDAGASWSAVNSGLPVADVEALAVSPNFATDHTLFAGTHGYRDASGVYESTDAGLSWRAVNTGLTVTGVAALAISPNFASDHTIFAGTYGGGAFSYTFPPSRNYYWAWYDSTGGMQNWVLMANPSGAPGNLQFDLDIAGAPRLLGNLGTGVGAVPAGKALTPIYSGVIGGPVKVRSETGDKAIVSQRSLMGNSFEEVLGTDAGKLSDHYYWTWYDQQSPGMTNWVLVANPSGADTVHAVISFKNSDGTPVSQESNIAPGNNWTPTFPGKMGGPVEVKAYKAGGSWPADKMNVIASQRVLSNYGAAFNEVPGIPAADLASDYLWTWYDNASPGATDWVLVANPGVDHTGASQGTVSATVKIGAATYGPYSIAPGHNITPTFPGAIGGPVEVTSTGGDVIATQRSLFGPSFEEVPGYAQSALASDYHWTWYDQQSAGSTNWVLVANPGNADVTYQIKIAGVVQPITADNPGTIPAHGKVTPTFPTKIGGPVEVTSTGGPVMASQRVLWNGYFNEVLGTVLG
ncbi:MAG: WD40/YVTN/BNR-like repeat-containing protein [Thermoleophilia bacterium]